MSFAFKAPKIFKTPVKRVLSIWIKLLKIFHSPTILAFLEGFAHLAVRLSILDCDAPFVYSMTTQPEQTLENNLISQLQQLGYKKVLIPDEAALLANLKTQLEKHNKTPLSENEFAQILNAINKGNVFERAKILRDRVQYTDDAGEHRTIELINQIHWCQNGFKVAQQISMRGLYKNRYDVTVLVNGLPLMQVNLKRRGLELKEAFKQTSRYGIHSFDAGQGLFKFIQIFVISNGVNTKYYANGPLKHRSFKQTF